MPKTRVRSSLRFSNFREIDGVSFWDLNEIPTIEEQGDDLTYTVRDFDRLDRIATLAYGDPLLWRIIAVANDIELVPSELNPGDELRIPSPRYVREVLFKAPRTKF